MTRSIKIGLGQPPWTLYFSQIDSLNFYFILFNPWISTIGLLFIVSKSLTKVKKKSLMINYIDMWKCKSVFGLTFWSVKFC